MKKVKVVIGAGMGDEGKGLFVDYLCSLLINPLVIRFSGGQQAGHTVICNGMRHVFSNFGSGTMRDAPTFWSRFCTVDPIGICNELEDLRGIGLNPMLMIDPRCPITTPYDKSYNCNLNAGNRHGSCCVGVGATFEREKMHYSLLFGDLYYPMIFKNKLDMIVNYYSSKHIK